MGTISTKFLVNQSGMLAEQAAVKSTAGAGDANKLVALNDTGIVDPTMINSTVTSAGSGSGGKLVALDSSGRIDVTAMPVGLGADTNSITTSEALVAGDYVNVWNSTGAKVRKADATVSGKEAHGFVLVAVAMGGSATVYFEGTNTAVTGQTPGNVFLSITAGTGQVAAPTASGNIVQRIGFCISATSVNFQSQPPIQLA